MIQFVWPIVSSELPEVVFLVMGRHWFVERQWFPPPRPDPTVIFDLYVIYTIGPERKRHTSSGDRERKFTEPPEM